jgi:trehalose synthase
MGSLPDLSDLRTFNPLSTLQVPLRAVIGGDVGGIRHQIVNGLSGFLVADVQQAAMQIGLLLGDQRVRRNMGRRARARVRRHFLMTRLLEEWLDLIAGLIVRSPD